MNKNIKAIAQGSMIAALFGVIAIINTYTGGVVDLYFTYFMIGPVIWYCDNHGTKYGLTLVFASFVILFLAGSMYFTVFTSSALLIGVYMSYCKEKNMKEKTMKKGMFVLDIIRNIFIYFIISTLLGFDGYAEFSELASSIPIIGNIIPGNLLIIILLILITLMEVYVINLYSHLVIKIINKRTNVLK